MSLEKFNDNCPGCRPVVFDPTGKRLPKHSPEVRAVSRIWDLTPSPQRRAWHRITCQGSQDQADLETVEPFLDAMREALERVLNSMTANSGNN